MKILVEECAYDPVLLKGVLPEGRLLLTGDKVKIEHVGYFRSAACDDFVFFLPKVVLEPKTDNATGKTENLVLGKYRPEDLVDLESFKVAESDEEAWRRERDFLYEFSVWIYRAIARYEKMHEPTDAVWRNRERQSGGFRRRYVTNTLLDVILALIRFNRDHADYFTFRVKENRSGRHRINWTRTIAKSAAVIEGGAPVYLDVRTKEKAVNYDEELLVIFYSILDYVNRQYGFNTKFNLDYELIRSTDFRRYLNGYGETRLRQIKYKYFSDRDLALWDLCFAFFQKAHRANVVSKGEEYLIAKNFEIVFEAMIDDLLGDREIAKLKELEDGKEIDHLYLDESLTSSAGRKTFYIADSKYYMIGRSLEGRSVAKQFTYARDMLQLNLDLFLPGDAASDRVRRWRDPFKGKDLGLQRDPVTEGYDVIPNFFISATMDRDFDYDHDGLEKRRNGEANEFHSIHFRNRLFDRDTLILSHYDVNFLYVLKLYVQNDESLKDGFKAYVQGVFRRKIRELLNGKDGKGGRFQFRAMMPHGEGEDAKRLAHQFFEENFRATLGKVYTPYLEAGECPVYLLALQRPNNIFDDGSLSKEAFEDLRGQVSRENEMTLQLLQTAFYVTDEIALGEDPREKLLEMAQAKPIPAPGGSTGDGGVQVISGVRGPFKQAVEESGWCPCPQEQCSNPQDVRILVLPYTMGANLYRVKAGTLHENVDRAGLYLLAGEMFRKVLLPSSPCHVWQIEKI